MCVIMDIIMSFVFIIFLGLFLLGVEAVWYYSKNGCFPSDDEPTYTEDD